MRIALQNKSPSHCVAPHLGRKKSRLLHCKIGMASVPGIFSEETGSYKNIYLCEFSANILANMQMGEAFQNIASVNHGTRDCQTQHRSINQYKSNRPTSIQCK
jgi:hypothetical protein